ncbi:MAG: hypothetical protein IJU50_01180 [Lachnospiraceae bacterium]|nr:hypothetical protein [Lachnospiraceae bacterium]
MKIWAHRGCSLRYPENTLTAFKEAAELHKKGLTGIELDVQLSRDGEIVVIHDERIDRTTDGHGFVKDYTLQELKTFHIHTGKAEAEHIPTLKEVLELLKDTMQKGLRLNIELKNSVIPYPGMEEKVVAMIHSYGLDENVVYSSFYAKSLAIIHALDDKAECGILDSRLSDCFYKAKGMGFISALHPFLKEIDFTQDESVKIGWIGPVRAWLTGYLYPEPPSGARLDLPVLENKGITDVFLNEPEAYL